MKKFLLGLVLLLSISCPLFGQSTSGFHRVAVALARASSGVTAQVIPNAKVTITSSATGLAATIYSDPALSSQITPAVVTADNSGNYGYYLALGYCVTETITSPGQGTQIITNICQNSGSGGCDVNSPNDCVITDPTGSQTINQPEGTWFDVESACGGLAIGSVAMNYCPDETGNSANVALGLDVMENTDAGGIQNNVGIGNDAFGDVGQNAVNNIAIGNDTMEDTSLSTSSSAIVDNIALGNNAMHDNGAGTSENVALGDNAMEDSTNGPTYSVGIGYYALNDDGSGANNVAIGNYASEDIGGSTSSRNVSIGYYAATDSSNANNDNVAIGTSALEDASSASGTVAIGLSAGYNGTNLAGTGSVFLGENTVPYGTGDTNETVLTPNTTGNGSNTVTIGNSSDALYLDATNLSDIFLNGLNPVTTKNYSGTGTPSDPCSATQYTSVIEINSTPTSYQCSNATGSYAWNLLAGGVSATFTASGCSNSTLVGNSLAGSYNSGTTGTCTVTVTTGVTVAHGYACSVWDVTTTADAQKETATTATTITFSGTTVSGDKIVFGCHPY